MNHSDETRRANRSFRRDLAEVRLRQLEYAAQARQVAPVVLVRGFNRAVARLVRFAIRRTGLRRSARADASARHGQACCS